ncbi:hypothetical protein TURU_029746 [Turdus rufiventris]|nr:hypothetical protein TURU_029746 [Turdus rufiventris]
MHSLDWKGLPFQVEDKALLSPGANPVLLLFAFARCKFFSLTETPEDYTIIVDEEGFLVLNDKWTIFFVVSTDYLQKQSHAFMPSQLKTTSKASFSSKFPLPEVIA